MSHRLVFLLRRRPELSREEFQSYWRNTHAPLVAARADTLGIRKYQQVHTVADVRSTAVPAFDGSAELWFDRDVAVGSPEDQARASQELLDDERNFIHLEASPLWYSEEHVVLAGPQEGLRTTVAMRRKPGLTRDQFRTHWRDVHGPWALAQPDTLGFTSYVQLHTPDDADGHRGAVARNAPPAFDGVAEIYARTPGGTPEQVATMRAELVADEARFLDTMNSPVFTGRVHVIVDRT